MIAYTLLLRRRKEYLFDCLIVFSPNSKCFHWYGDVTTLGYGLQMLTYTKHYSIFNWQEYGALWNNFQKSRKQSRKRGYRSILLGCHLLIVWYHDDGNFFCLEISISLWCNERWRIMLVYIEQSWWYLICFHNIEISRFTTSIIVISVTIISIPWSAADVARLVRKFYWHAGSWASSIGQNLQCSTWNSDVSKWVKISRVWQKVNK